MDSNDMRQDDEQLAALLQFAGARPAMPPEVARRVRLAVHETWHDELRRAARRRAAAWIGGVAAAALAAALLVPLRHAPTPAAPPELVAIVQVSGGTTSVRAGDRVAAGSIVSTSPSSFATLQWRGHGSLRVAADSRLRFTGGGTIELRRGAIYFASAAAGKPVEIRTPFGIVRDVGTAFEVRIEPAALRVRVREGVVELQRNGTRERANAGIELLAGQGGVARRAISTAGPDWNWILAAAPPIVLDGNARAVLAAIAREKGLTLMFSDRGLADRVDRMSLHDHVPLTPDEALAAATTAADLSYRLSSNALVIERKQRR